MTSYTFYKLECINGSTDEFYIGSTNNLFRRQSKCKSYVNDATKLDKKHTIMRLHGGFNNWKWVILETGVYALELHAHVREQQLIDLHQPTMNTLRAYQTLEQRRENKNAHNNTTENRQKQKLLLTTNRDQYNANRRAKSAAKRALLLQPVDEPIDEPISPHAESVH
jgi:hypothetical protein